MDYKRIHIVIGDASWIEDIKKILEETPAVEVHFINQENWHDKRKEIYHSFRNNEFTIERISRTEAHVLITNDLIRTSRVEQVHKDLPSATALKYPAELSLKSRGILSDFEGSDVEVTEINGVKVYPCACCGRYLPVKEFGHRSYNGIEYRQSYCNPCMRLYSYWRDTFLRQHNADRLTPNFTEGRRQRNEIFRAWYEENYK